MIFAFISQGNLHFFFTLIKLLQATFRKGMWGQALFLRLDCFWLLCQLGSSGSHPQLCAGSALPQSTPLGAPDLAP